MSKMVEVVEAEVDIRIMGCHMATLLVLDDELDAVARHSQNQVVAEEL